MTFSPPSRRCGERARGAALWCCAIALGALSASACAKPQAKTLPAPPAPPPLNVPAPPPPYLVPVTIPVAEAPPPVVDPGTATPPAREKPPTTKPTTPPPVTPPPTTPPPPDPPVLQTTRNPGELENRARADLSRADQILSKIEVSRLTPEARDVYESATSFRRQAETALRDKNFVAAALHADKAFTFAQALVKDPRT